MFEAYLREKRESPEYREAEEELRPYLDLADDVLALRLERGWSQSELARRTKTGQANISRVEDGLANPTIKFLQKLAKALGMQLEIRLRRPGTLIPREKELKRGRFASTPGTATDSPGNGPTVIPTIAPGGGQCFQFLMSSTNESETLVTEGTTP